MYSTNTLPTPTPTPTVSANEVINQSINNMETLMKAVYGQVKDACAPVDLLSTDNASAKKFIIKKCILTVQVRLWQLNKNPKGLID